MKLNYILEAKELKVYFTEGTTILNGRSKIVKEFTKVTGSKAIKGTFILEAKNNKSDMVKSLVTFAEAQNIEIYNIAKNEKVNTNLLNEIEEKAAAGKQINILDLIQPEVKEEAPTAPAATHGVILEEKHTHIITGETKTYKPAPAPAGTIKYTFIQKNLVILFLNEKGQKILDNEKYEYVKDFILLTQTFPVMGKFTIREEKQKVINHLPGFASKHNLILVDKTKPGSEEKEIKEAIKKEAIKKEAIKKEEIKEEIKAPAPEKENNNIFVFYSINKTFSIHILKDFKLIDSKDPILTELINKYKFSRHSDTAILKINIDINIMNSLRRSVINYANKNNYKVYDFKGKHFISIDKETLKINMENASEEINNKIKSIIRPDLKEEAAAPEKEEFKKHGFYVIFENEIKYFNDRADTFHLVKTIKRDPINEGKTILVDYVSAKGKKTNIYKKTIEAAAPAPEKKEVNKEEKEKDKLFKDQMKKFTDVMAIEEINKGAISEFLMEIIERVSAGNYHGINNRLILIATLFLNNIDLKYLDKMHTFAGWKNRGYQVQKGEKATIKTSLWIKKDIKKKASEEIEPEAAGEETENKTYSKFYLKVSNLFTIDQVKQKEDKQGA